MTIKYVTDEAQREEVAWRFAKAFIGYTSGLSDWTMEKQMNRERLGQVWYDLADACIAHFQEEEHADG